MNLVDIYSLLTSKEITEQQAAATLGLQLKQLRMRLTKGGGRLALTLRTLDQIREDKISREDAAELLKVTPRNINKLMESWSVVRPIKEYEVVRATSKIKWEVSKKFAIDFISGTATLEECADAAQMSERSMRRWINKLLKKHLDMPWGDLKFLTDTKRWQIAKEIDEAESMDLAKQGAINAIANGDKTVEDVALERVTARRAQIKLTRKANNV